MKMTDARRCFIDTNILLAATDSSRPEHPAALELLRSGLSGERKLFASGQVFREYLVVSTRPAKNNGLGIRPDKAVANISEFRKCIQLLDETDAVARRLANLIADYKLRGKRIHDANLIAIMLENGLDYLRSNNSADFTVFKTIQVEGLD
ncbi:MAG: type II toxin-antitoxin system VapC family toxin [Coraliomargarita sp.]